MMYVDFKALGVCIDKNGVRVSNKAILHTIEAVTSDCDDTGSAPRVPAFGPHNFAHELKELEEYARRRRNLRQKHMPVTD